MEADPRVTMVVVVGDHPSLPWTQQAMLTTSNNTMHGCSSRPSTTLSTPCSCSSTTNSTAGLPLAQEEVILSRVMVAHLMDKVLTLLMVRDSSHLSTSSIKLLLSKDTRFEDKLLD